MENPFKINKSFVVRHKILEVLYNESQNNGNEEKKIGSIRISSSTKIHIDEIHLWQNPLIGAGEISATSNEGQIMMSISDTGKNSFIERKYLKQGRKEKIDGIYDYIKIVAPLLAFALSIYALVSNNQLRQKVNQLEKQINSKK